MTWKTSFENLFTRRRRSGFTAGTASVQADTWRPALELNAVYLWSATALVGAGMSITNAAPLFPTLPLTFAAAGMAAWRLMQALTVLKARAALGGTALQVIPLPAFAARIVTMRRQVRDRQVKRSPSLKPARSNEGLPVWFGTGFEWKPEHAQKLYELSKIDAERLVPPAWLCRRLTQSNPKDPDTVGLAAIDGLETDKQDIWVAEKTLEGGTLIVGTTQAGKGVLLTSLVTQAILKGDAVIVIDPKMSHRLKDAVEAAAELAGRSAPLVFHPSRADGLRINPLRHFTQPSEIASRITAVMADNGPFTAYAWNAAHMIVDLMVHVGRVTTLAGLQAALSGGFEDLILEGLKLDCGKDVFEAYGAKAELHNLKGRDAALYMLEAAKKDDVLSESVLKAYGSFAHDPVHFSKITAGLMPVLSMLTSGALRQTLSPEQDDAEAMTIGEIIAQRKILYVCLNSLPDPTVAGAIGSLFLADLASCAGNRYNDPSIERTVVHLFVDESSNVINRSLIEILNKGAESGLRTTCAMQTVADLAARLGSTDEARMALGNFNTLVSLRTKDRLTQEFVAETFGRTYIANTAAALTSNSDTDHPGHFSAGSARHISSTREEIIPCDVLGKLPNCEFFASLAGGRLIKGRTPILVCPKPDKTEDRR